MKPLTPQQPPEVSGGWEDPSKHPHEVSDPIFPMPMPYPREPICPVIDDRIIDTHDQ